MKDLSPRELARALGVSESSVKRWVDEGRLSAVRTAGGHRRIAGAEAVRFVRQSGMAVVRPDVIAGAEINAAFASLDSLTSEEVADRLFGLLDSDESAAARALLLGLYVKGWSVASICDGPVRLALERIGTLWQHGQAGIVTEHRATDTCQRVLAEIRALTAAPAADAPSAIGGAPRHDPYLLPSMMAATVLADLGFRDHNLGPDLPIGALDLAARHYRPRLVWLAMSVTREIEGLTPEEMALAARLARHGATLVIGGRGAPTPPPTPGILRIHSMAELAAFAKGIQAGGTDRRHQA